MKKKITDLFDDLPIEMIDEIQAVGKKKKAKILRRAAAIVIGAACLLASAAGYAAVKHPELFNIYFRDDDEVLKSRLIKNQHYEVKNKDYCLRVEDVMTDGNVKTILVSVEALNEESLKILKDSKTPPQLMLGNKAGGAVSSGGSVQEYNYYLEEGKKYFMFQYTSNGDMCTVIYAEGMEPYPERKWMEEHAKEILKVSFEFEDDADYGIHIVPKKNEFPEDVVFEKIEVRSMSVKAEGISRERKEGADDTGNKYYYPTVTALMKDGSSIKLMDGNMGHEDMETDVSYKHRASSCTYDDGTGEIKIVQVFWHAFNTDDIDQVLINDVEYKIER